MPSGTLAKLGRAIVEPSLAARGVWRRITDRVDTTWFPYFERIGIHTKKVHFYSPIPNTRELSDELWTRRSSLPGINMRLEEQAALAEELGRRYRDEFAAFPLDPTGDPHQFYLRNNMYGCVDAEVLYGLVRQRRPKRIVEIGSGFSTLVASRALSRNHAEGYTGSITAIEPYPRPFLTGLPHLGEIVQQEVQALPLERFEALESDDILFIDSTHVAKIGSDVCYELLEIVPRLRPGVLIHIHDVFFPEEYPKPWIMDYHFFWNEQYMLQAFLAFNDRFRVLWAGRYMHLNRPEVLERAFPSYPGESSFNFPASFWMQRAR